MSEIAERIDNAVLERLVVRGTRRSMADGTDMLRAGRSASVCRHDCAYRVMADPQDGAGEEPAGGRRTVPADLVLVGVVEPV